MGPHSTFVPKAEQCGVSSCLGYFSDLHVSAIFQPLWPTGAQLFQAITLCMGHQARQPPVAPRLSTFHHALTVVVPMWITLVPNVWEVLLDYGDGMTGISSYLPFVQSILDLIAFSYICAGFGSFKEVCCGDRCTFSRINSESDTEKQPQKIPTYSDVRGRVSSMTFDYLYCFLKSEPVGERVIQEDQRAFHTALEHICFETVGGKAADTRHLLGKCFQHFLFSLTADLLPDYEPYQNNSTQPTCELLTDQTYEYNSACNVFMEDETYIIYKKRFIHCIVLIPVENLPTYVMHPNHPFTIFCPMFNTYISV